jgi:hypothetical protein
MLHFRVIYLYGHVSAVRPEAADREDGLHTCRVAAHQVVSCGQPTRVCLQHMKDIRKVRIQNPENTKHLLFTCSTFTTHLYLLFNIVSMDRNALSEPGKEFFLFQRGRNLPPALLTMENSF